MSHLDAATLEELLRLEREATAGPWVDEYDEDDGHLILMGEATENRASFASHLKWSCDHALFPDEEGPVAQRQFAESEANAALIVAMRNAIGPLIARLQAAEAELQSHREGREELFAKAVIAGLRAARAERSSE